MTRDQLQHLDLLFGTGDDPAAATKAAIALAAMIAAVSRCGVSAIVVTNKRGETSTIRLDDAK